MEEGNEYQDSCRDITLPALVMGARHWGFVGRSSCLGGSNDYHLKIITWSICSVKNAVQKIKTALLFVMSAELPLFQPMFNPQRYQRPKYSSPPNQNQ